MYRCTHIALLWALILTGSLAHTAEVLKVGGSQRVVAITHEEFRRWGVKDYVCFFRGTRELICGVVVKVTPKGAIVKLDSPSMELAAGDAAKISTKLPPSESFTATEESTADPVTGSKGPSGRKPALALLDSVEKDKNTQEFAFNIAGGIGAGLNFFYPQIDLQRTITPQVAIGLTTLYFRNSRGNDSAGALGLFLTGNYYRSDYFRGMWIQSGPGVLFFSSQANKIEESATSLAFKAIGGWRGYWDLGLNIGVGAGFQYVIPPGIVATEIRSAGIQPLVVLDLGFNF